jgi:hypothetical protein
MGLKSPSRLRLCTCIQKIRLIKVPDQFDRALSIHLRKSYTITFSGINSSVSPIARAIWREASGRAAC